MKKFKLKKNIDNQISSLIYARKLKEDSIINNVHISVACLVRELVRTSVWNAVYDLTKTLNNGLMNHVFKNDLQKNFKRKKNK